MDSQRRHQQKHNGGLRRIQSGAAAVEFAIVFPLLFALMYATIVYGYVFFAQQTINMVAQEVAKAAVAAAPYDEDGKPAGDSRYANAARIYFAAAQTSGPLQYLLGSTVLYPKKDELGTTSLADGGGEIFTVTITLEGLTENCEKKPGAADPEKPKGAFPTINLSIMGLGCVPPLPDTLSATASVRVS